VIVLSAGTVSGSTPEPESAAVQWIVTSPRNQRPLSGAVVGTPARSGAVVSMRIGPTVVLARSPALSTAVPVTSWSAASPVTVWSGVQLAIPDVASVQSKWTVTSWLYQPTAFGGVVAEPVIRGATVSIASGPTRTLAVLPATSTAVPVTDWSRPSRSSVIGAGQVLMPDSASEQVKTTRTVPV
jgi:hypothetical protein